MKFKWKSMKVLAIAFWIIVWGALAYLLKSALILPSPQKVLQDLVQLIAEPSFWRTCISTTGRIWTGFLLGAFGGMLWGYLGAKSQVVRIFLEPLIVAMKSVPIAAFVILALIYYGASGLSVITAAIVTFPQVYTALQIGMKNQNTKMKEMAKVFCFSKWKTFYYIEMHAVYPFVLAAAKVAMGMSWKAGIAAEVIGLPSVSIGEAFYMSKIYLDTPKLLAWTVVVIGLSVTSEKLILVLLKGWKKYGY